MALRHTLAAIAFLTPGIPGAQALASDLAEILNSVPVGLVAHTDKASYEIDETVDVSIDNRSTDTTAVFWQCHTGSSQFIHRTVQRQGETGWEDYFSPACPALYPPIPLEIVPGESYSELVPAFRTVC